MQGETEMYKNLLLKCSILKIAVSIEPEKTRQLYHLCVELNHLTLTIVINLFPFYS